MSRPGRRTQHQSRHPSDRELEGLHLAQGVARALSEEIAGAAEPGMTERELSSITTASFRVRGLKHHWHSPVVGLAEGTMKLQHAKAIISDRLSDHACEARDGDMVYIDVAPFVDGQPADYTVCRVLGFSPEMDALASTARELAAAAVSHIRAGMVAAEVHEFVARTAEARGYRLIDPPIISMGHRIGAPPTWWPKVPELGTISYLLMCTKGPFLNERNHTSMDGLWTIEPYITDGRRAAKHEEMVFVSGSEVLRIGHDT